MKITFDMTATDFDYLTQNQMRWAGNDWEQQKDRFETVTIGTVVDFKWHFAYWVNTYADYLLAAAYLASIDYPHQALFDTADSDVVILTDYAGNWSD